MRILYVKIGFFKEKQILKFLQKKFLRQTSPTHFDKLTFHVKLSRILTPSRAHG